MSNNWAKDISSPGCKPLIHQIFENITYKVWCEKFQDEEDAKTYTTLYPESAAKLYAKDMDVDSCNYTFVNGNDLLVVNVKDSDGVITKWSVEGDWEPLYYASEVK